MIVKHIDHSEMEGGLGRMLDRYREEGTLTGDPTEDAYLAEVPAAALLGLLYDQRVRAEYAFAGPRRLQERLGHLDLKVIATMPAEAFQKRFAETPAVHRFTNRMAEYTQLVAKAVADSYAGEAAAIWNDGVDFDTVQRRLLELPGFGKGKAAKMKYVLHYLGYRDFSG
jgi:uncharacterized HhH-GPD family protein